MSNRESRSRALQTPVVSMQANEPEHTLEVASRFRVRTGYAIGQHPEPA